MKKKLQSLLAASAMVLSLTACGGEGETGGNSTNAPSTPTAVPQNTQAPENTPMDAPAQDTPTIAPEQDTMTDAPDTVPGQDTPVAEGSWAIYWYLCGSDLESGGGSSVWHNDFVDASKLQRYVYDNEGLKLADEQPSASMGEAQTLADFLSFARTNFPAEKTAVVFWNHGGGSVSGAAFDELYDNDSLTLDEMYAAFSSVWEPSGQSQPLELIGFDTCLMATVDVANIFATLAHYMVASEECEPAGTQDNTALSLTDLSKIGPLLTAYETFGGAQHLSISTLTS